MKKCDKFSESVVFTLVFVMGLWHFLFLCFYYKFFIPADGTNIVYFDKTKGLKEERESKNKKY